MTDQIAAPPTAPATGALSHQVSRAMLWNAGWQAVKLLAGFVSAIVVANLLSKEGYGTVARLSALAATFGLIADFGVERGLAKFLPEIESRYGRGGVRRTLQLVIAQKLVVVVGIVLVCLIFRERIFAYWEAGVQDGDVTATLRTYRWLFFSALMALVFFGAVYDVYMQTLTAYFKQRASGAIGFVAQILSPLLRLGIILVGWGILGFVGALVTIPLVATALAAWQAATVRRELAERPVLPAADARVPQRLVAYSALSYWQQLTEYLYSLDFVVLMIPGAAAVASFKFAHSLINQTLSALWSPLSGVQIPLFARLHIRDERRQLQEAYGILSKFLIAVMLPAAVGLALLAYNLIAVLGAKYIDAAWVARILALTLFLDAAISVPLAILMAYERYRPMLISRTCALVAVPLVFVVVPRFGIVGAALAMGGVRLFCDSLAMALAIRHFSLRYPLRFAARVGVATLAMAVVIAPLAFTVLRTPLPWDAATDLTRHSGLSYGTVLGAQAPWEVAARLSWRDQALYGLGNALLGGVGALIYLGAFRLTGGIDPADRRRIAELRLPFAAKVLRFL